MKLKFVLSAALAALMFVGCGRNETEEITETSVSETVTTTENKYWLVRGWEGYELLDSIFYCGEKHSLPLSLEENPDFIFDGGTLIFPDGSFAEAAADENGSIISMRLKAESAPADFSVYGIGFDAGIYDIPSIAGIANDIYGDEETVLTYSFFEGGITELTFIFTEGMLTEIYIAA